MRVLFVTPNLGVGGAERQWVTMIPELARRGIIPEVLTLDAEGALAPDLRAQGVTVGCAAIRHRGDLRGIARGLRSVGDEVAVVVSEGFSALVVGTAIAKMRRITHVHAAHDAALYGPSRQRLLPLIAPLVDRVVAVAETQIPMLISAGFAPETILVIRNGVDHTKLVPRRPRRVVREELEISQEAVVAFVAARLQPEKRLDVFISAIKAAHRRDPNIIGVVAGEGNERPELERQIAAECAPVRLLGVRSDIAELLHASDLVCLSSDFEALPMTLLEAMAVGRPVVSTGVGGVEELVTHERTGLLVLPGDVVGFADAVVRLATDPLLREVLGVAGRNRQRAEFSAKVMVTQYETLLRGLAISKERATVPRSSEPVSP